MTKEKLYFFADCRLQGAVLPNCAVRDLVRLQMYVYVLGCFYSKLMGGWLGTEKSEKGNCQKKYVKAREAFF
jgi:hypothetical protein